MRLKKSYKFLLAVLAIIFLLTLVFYFLVRITPPEVKATPIGFERELLSEDHYVLGPHSLKKNKYGIWEMYVEGEAYERGLAIGQLSQELIYFQEDSFSEEVIGLLPSKVMMHLLKYVVAWKNKDIQDYIPDEFEREIYGISQYCSDDFDYIGPKFHRKLFYHSAHDIGHTVQNMGLVGCSAFSAWGKHSADGEIITGRNFDFYIGESFKKNKLLLLMNPSQGHAFASYSWPGMMGVLSGMNVKGLTVSLNAGPPALPESAKMPVSILAREILQYASTIEEAVSLAKKREIFVSESFVISSAADGKSVIIEKTPDTTLVVQAKDDVLLCTNHFQSAFFRDMETNQEFKEISSTKRRIDRLNVLLDDRDSLDVEQSIEILRDMGEQDEQALGIGNEENINIMNTHHSIVFQPQKLLMWISVGDSPMEEYVSYDLAAQFRDEKSEVNVVHDFSEIPASPWVRSDTYSKYQKFRKTYLEIEKGKDDGKVYAQSDFDQMISNNSKFYKGYLLAGQYFQEESNCDLAITYLNQALEKVIPWEKDEQQIKELLSECQ